MDLTTFGRSNDVQVDGMMTMIWCRRREGQRYDFVSNHFHIHSTVIVVILLLPRKNAAEEGNQETSSKCRRIDNNINIGEKGTETEELLPIQILLPCGGQRKKKLSRNVGVMFCFRSRK